MFFFFYSLVPSVVFFTHSFIFFEKDGKTAYNFAKTKKVVGLIIDYVCAFLFLFLFLFFFFLSLIFFQEERELRNKENKELKEKQIKMEKEIQELKTQLEEKTSQV